MKERDLPEDVSELKTAPAASGSGTNDKPKAKRIVRPTSNGPLDQTLETVRIPSGTTEEEKIVLIRHGVELFDGTKPTDEIEGMLAALMVGIHNASMECLRRANLSNQSNDDRDQNLKHAAKLPNTFANLLEALNKYRGQGQQKIIVKHVHVEAGANAIVGNIDSTRQKKSGDQLDLVPKAIPFLPGKTLDLSVESQVPVEILRN